MTDSRNQPPQARMRPIRRTDPAGVTVYGTSDRDREFPATLLAQWDQWAWIVYNHNPRYPEVKHTPVTTDSANLWREDDGDHA